MIVFGKHGVTVETAAIVTGLAACLRAFDVHLTRQDWYQIVVASQREPLP